MNSEFPLLDASDPTSCLCGRIMLSERIISGIYRKHLSQFDLTNSQLTILLVINRMGNISQADLSKMLVLEKSSVSRNMKRLLTSDYIKRGKARKLEITLNGKTLLESLIPAWDAAKAEVDEMLGEEGQEAMNMIVNKLTKNNF
ncbi:MAG: MarR family winged helix-turn-helix transcriptional regulator [Chitinophagales bacterium]